MTESLVFRVQRLRAEVAEHKAVINRRRKALRLAAAALDLALEEHQAECRRRGIAFVTQPSGTGDLHSHVTRSSSRPLN